MEDLKNRLAEAEETLEAIRSGTVDAVVVSAPEGEKVYTLKGAEYPYRVFFETMNEGGAVISDEGLILACNKGFERMVGVDLAKLSGSSFYDFVPSRERKKISRFVKSVCNSGTDEISQQAVRGETMLVAPGGRRVPVQLALSAVHEIEKAHVCVVITDLTDQKRAEEVLRRSHDELELKVRERTAELQASSEELQVNNEELQVMQEELQIQNDELRTIRDELAQAQVKAENERRLLAAVMEALPTGVAITDALGGNIRANSTFDRIWGGPLPATRSVKGYAAYNAWWAETGKPVKPEEWASAIAVKTGETVVGQLLRIQRFDGTEAFVLNSASPVRDVSGNIVGSAVAIQDITDLKRAEQALRSSEQRLRLALEASSMGTFEFNLLTKKELWSDAEFELLGLQPGDVLPDPETFFRCVHPEDVAMLRAKWEEALRGETLDTEFRIVRADGEVRWLAGKGKFVLEGKPDANPSVLRGQTSHFMGVNFDITIRKNSELQIKALNEQLKRQVDELDAANQELDAFCYSISHDLRAPLLTISGFIKILVEDFAERLDDQGRDYLGRVYNGSVKMGKLIDALLRLTHISRQELGRTEFNIGTLASSIVEGLRAADPGRSVEVSIESGITVFADPGLMDVVLSNLLGNAWKFTSNTGNALVEFGTFKQNGKTVYYVRDNGAGFNPQFKEKLFLPFQRLHPDQEFEGTGIGLSIVERIIYRHGGRIWAEGEVGKGATFYFTLA